MNAITMILTTIIVLIVLALALFGLLAAASWIAGYRYEIPADSIDAIEEAVEDMRDHYRTVDNPDKQTTALNEIWEQVQIIKDLETKKSQFNYGKF